MAGMDPYEVLGVAKGASPDEIRTAYRQLARQYHPDVNPDNPRAEETFKTVNEAYGILSDPEKRERFDRTGSVEEQPAEGFFNEGGIADIFEAFFGGGGVRTGRKSTGRDGEDLQVELYLTLNDVLTGATKAVTYRRMARCGECNGTGAKGGARPDKCPNCGGSGMVSRLQNTFIGAVRTSTTCPTCNGSGEVVKEPCKACHGRGLSVEEVEQQLNVPAGVDTGSRMRVAGRGSDGVGTGRSGDLYVMLVVHDDPRFERDGSDLHAALDLTFAQAAIGDTVEAEGLEGLIEVEVSPGTQPGSEIRLRGHGLPRLHGGPKGDLVMHVRVAVPNKVSEAQQKLLREFAELGGEPIPKGPPAGSFLGGIFKGKAKGKGKKQ